MDEKVELYRIMVETVTANENRRHQISSVYLALAAAAFGLISTSSSVNLSILAVGGLFLSVVWLFQIKYLKRLAKAKFDVILRLEMNFSSQPFSEEWDYMQGGKKTNWIRMSNLEMLLPIFILIGCSVYLVLPVFKHLVCGY